MKARTKKNRIAAACQDGSDDINQIGRKTGNRNSFCRMGAAAQFDQGDHVLPKIIGESRVAPQFR